MVAQNTNIGPYPATEPLQWLTTDDYVAFTLNTTNLTISPNGVFQFGTPAITSVMINETSAHLNGSGAMTFAFTNGTGLSFSVLGRNKVAAPVATWPVVGPAVETPAGSWQYQFTDPSPATNTQRFYLLRQP